MQNYTCQVSLNVPPAAAYHAIASIDGLRKWWTEDTQGTSQEGSRVTFRFPSGFNVMQVEKLVPNKEVKWKCFDQHFADLAVPNEWVGTSLIFRLSPNSKGGTDLEFEHIGLTPSCSCFKLCEGGWNHFLKVSLKKYLETGKGDSVVCKEGFSGNF